MLPNVLIDELSQNALMVELVVPPPPQEEPQPTPAPPEAAAPDAAEAFEFEFSPANPSFALPEWRPDVLRSYEESDAPSAIFREAAIRAALTMMGGCADPDTLPPSVKTGGSAEACARAWARAAVIADALGVEPAEAFDPRVVELSAGQRRRIAIAQGLVPQISDDGLMNVAPDPYLGD
jgi:hypothetical protein